jgi:hypothetical protein
VYNEKSPFKEGLYFQLLTTYIGGEGGIRTHGTENRTLDFESSPFDHSGTSPFNADITRIF